VLISPLHTLSALCSLLSLRDASVSPTPLPLSSGSLVGQSGGREAGLLLYIGVVAGQYKCGV
jgi:hypothetical protein